MLKRRNFCTQPISVLPKISFMHDLAYSCGIFKVARVKRLNMWQSKVKCLLQNGSDLHK